MLETGEFEVPHSYIGVGDEYVEHREKPLHHIKGVKQFVVSSPKKGQTAGTLGGTYTAKPLFDGEPYEDVAKLSAKEKVKAREKFTNPRGFVPSSPGKKRTGAGTYDGAFSQHEHMDDGIYTKKKVRTEAETRRPILTSPPKKGGPGFPGRTLGPDPEFKADTYGEMETRLRAERKEKAKKVGDRKPFSSTVASRGLPLDARGAAGVSTVYGTDEKVLPPKPDPTAGKPPKALIEEKKAKEPEKPFVQSSPGKRGPFAGTFQPFPKRSDDKYDPRGPQLAMRPARLAPDKERNKHLPEKLRERPSFKPTSGPKSSLTRSVAHARIHAATLGRSVGGRRR